MKDVRRERGLREEIVNLSFKLSNEYFILRRFSYYREYISKRV